MKPTRLLDPRFKWVPSEKTDIRKTFARVKREQTKATDKLATVTPIKKERTA